MAAEWRVRCANQRGAEDRIAVSADSQVITLLFPPGEWSTVAPVDVLHLCEALAEAREVVATS